MRKLSMLLGALGGAMAGYLFSNNTLRDELYNAKDAEAAGKILAKHLKKDGQKVGGEVKKFVRSDDVQRNLHKAKAYVQKKAKKLRGEITSYINQGAGKAKSAVSSGAKKVKKGVAKAGMKVSRV